MKMTNQTYDLLKWVALIALPAVVTFVAALGEIWGLPYTTQIAATIAAVDALLGACLQVSSANYTDKSYDDEADDARDDIEAGDGDE
jgi:hypothetical protein